MRLRSTWRFSLLPAAGPTVGPGPATVADALRGTIGFSFKTGDLLSEGSLLAFTSDLARLGGVAALLRVSSIRLRSGPTGLRGHTKHFHRKSTEPKPLPFLAILALSPVTRTDTPFRIRRLRRAELPIDTEALARFLIGKIVVRELPSGRLSGRIVETEAYPIGDPAAHHLIGPTPRNRSMFLSRGHAYVYFSYGNHFMLNISAEVPGVGGGVLIRALEPLEGIPQMQAHRGITKVTDLTRGPGRLAAALKIDRTLDGVDLCAPGPLWLGTLVSAGQFRSSSVGRAVAAHPKAVPIRTQSAVHRPVKIVTRQSVRIGITRAAHRLLRFYEKGNPFVSGPAWLRS